jgi:phenylalanyl-tRNA synthetase beta chain
MNILIPHSWLKEFIKTDATPPTIAEKLSLCSLSVEKLHQKGEDTVYEIEITPNRYDTLSVLGIAREVAAVLPRFGLKAELVPPDAIDAIDAIDANFLTVTITNPSLCPRFTAIVLDRVEIKPSPKIVRDRLEMSGVRALNNVVDVSNYLMLELGQPMHIFDFDKLGNVAATHASPNSGRASGSRLQKNMILRESQKGEKLMTLDGVSRTLPKEAIVIESGSKLIDLCGIMGGENSAVDESTKRILLFIQIYDPLRIRKTSQSLGLRTDASTRFEKGIDPAGILPAMNRAVEMLQENAGAKVASQLIDIKNEEWQPHEVELEIPEVERLLGVRIEKEEIIQILKSLGFEITVKNSAFQIPTLIAQVPSWRDKDVIISADLVEEVARLYGYHNLPNEMPTGAIPTTPREKRFYWEDKSKDFLKHQGFYEVYNYSFISKNALQNVAATHASPEVAARSPKALKVRNPLSSELEYLRPSLLPSLIQNLEENKGQALHCKAWPCKLFELERIYLPQKGGELPKENFRLAGLVSNQQFNNLTIQPFYFIKGIVEGLLKELGIKDVTFQPDLQNPSTTSVIRLRGGQGRQIGTIGWAEKSALFFDLNFDTIVELATDQKTYTPIPEYPPIIEDLSIILPPKTFIADVISEIKKQSKLIKEVEVADIYPEKGSVTLRLTYQHAKKTLTDTKIATIRQKIITGLEKNLKVKIRSGQ